MTSKYSEYLSFMEKYRDELKIACDNERGKRQSLLENDMDKLEAVISLQQAQTMKLSALEAKRIQLQSEHISGDATAKEFLASMNDGEDKKCLEALLFEISELVTSIKDQNRLSLELAQTNLKILDRVLQKDGFDGQKNVYGPDSGRKNTYSSGKTFEGKA